MVREGIKLGLPTVSMEEAIVAAGELLRDLGYVDDDYIPAMIRRNEEASVYMGLGLAIPHGTEDAKRDVKRSGIIVMQYPDGVEFNGGTAGFVTMEDILEELVGNIFDEYDKLENDYEKIDDNTYIVSGSLPIYEFEKLLEVEIPEGDYDTISGYIIDELGRIPQNNEKVVVETELITYKIEECKNQRILKVKVCKNNPKKETQKEEEE